MDANAEMVDLTSDDHDANLDSHQSYAIPHQPATREEADQAIGSRLQSLAAPRASSGNSPAARWKSFAERKGLGQHSHFSPKLYKQNQSIEGEDTTFSAHSIEDPSDYNAQAASNASRHRSNHTSRRPSAIAEPLPQRPFQHIDVDMMDNERGPVRSDYQTPNHLSNADNNGMFVREDEDFPMDHTPTQKRRRIDSVSEHRPSTHDVRGGQQRQPPAAFMTPTASSRTRPSSSARPPSSSRSQAGLMGSQARSQLNGVQPIQFRPIPPSPFSSSAARHATPSSRTQAAARQPPGVITQEDLMPLFLELQSVIRAYQDATARLLQGQQSINTLRAEIKQEQKEQNDHMNKTLAKFAEANKKAIAEVHETTESLQHQIDQINKRDPKRTPPRGGAYGGSSLLQQPTSSGLFSDLINPTPQQETPASRSRTQSRALSTPGPNGRSS